MELMGMAIYRLVLVSHVREVGEVLEEAGTNEISMFDNGSGNHISVPAGGQHNRSC